MPTIMEQFITSTIERRVPYNGPVLSDVWNDMNEELVRDITTLQTLWNTLLYPLLGSLPSGPVEILATDRTGDISPFDNGLDGSQIYMDMTATLTDESYYSELLGRPFTIKEAFEAYQADVNEAIEDAKEAALLAGLTEDAKQKIGARIFYTGRTSSPDSLDGLLQRLDLLVDQIVADVFNEGYDTDAPPDYSSYPLSGGLQSRDNTIMEYIDSLLYAHDNAFGSAHIAIHHVFVDPVLEGQDGVPQVIVNMVKMSDEVLGDFDKTTGQWPGIPDHLEDELNQIRTAIRRLAGWVGPAYEDNIFSAGVALWTDLPYDYDNATRLSLKGHINRTGTGTQSATNPHGMHITDIDEYLILYQTADEVAFDPGPEASSGPYLDDAFDVHDALLQLEDQIEINENAIAALDVRVTANEADIVALDGRLTAAEGDIDDLEAFQTAHEIYINGDNPSQHGTVDIDAEDSWKSGTSNFTGASTLQDVLDIIDGAIDTLTANLAALAADYADHVAGTDDRHGANDIDFSSATSEPLEYPVGHAQEGDPITVVGDAINEFHQLWINDRILQDGKINAAAQEIQRYATTTIPTLFNHNFQIYVDPTGDDRPLLGDGTSALPYKTINRALQDIGKLVIPKAEIIIADGDYEESVHIDNIIFDLGELLIRGNASDPDAVRILGGSWLEEKVWFFGAGTYDMYAGGTYVPTIPGTKTIYYIEITTAGERAYVDGEGPLPTKGTSFDLDYIPDDDASVIFTDLTVFATEVPWSTYPGALAAGTYRINYKGEDALPATRVQTGSTLNGGFVSYYTVDPTHPDGPSIDRFRWWKDNNIPPADYDEWDVGTAYIIGDKVSHQTGWYECNTAHTGQEPPNASYWDVDPGPTGFAFITEEVAQSLDQGVNITFLSDSGHYAGDIFSFTAYPRLRQPLTFTTAKGVRVQDLLCDGGIRVQRQSDVELENIIAKGSLDYAILVTGGSHLRIEIYHMNTSPAGILARENSYVLALDYDNTLDTAESGNDVTGRGAYAEMHSGIESCINAPGGGAANGADAATFGYFTATCPTTTTTSSTTTTSTSTTSTTTTNTASTSSSTSTSTTSSTSSSTSSTTTTAP